PRDQVEGTLRAVSDEDVLGIRLYAPAHPDMVGYGRPKPWMPGGIAVLRVDRRAAHLPPERPPPAVPRKQGRVRHADAEVVREAGLAKGRGGDRLPDATAADRNAGSTPRADEGIALDDAAGAPSTGEQALGNQPLVGESHRVARHVQPPREVAGGRDPVAT